MKEQDKKELDINELDNVAGGQSDVEYKTNIEFDAESLRELPTEAIEELLPLVKDVLEGGASGKTHCEQKRDTAEYHADHSSHHHITSGD